MRPNFCEVSLIFICPICLFHTKGYTRQLSKRQWLIDPFPFASRRCMKWVSSCPNSDPITFPQFYCPKNAYILSDSAMLLSRSDLTGADIEGADFTNALVDKPQQMALCKYASGTNPDTGMIYSNSDLPTTLCGLLFCLNKCGVRSLSMMWIYL